MNNLQSFKDIMAIPFMRFEMVRGKPEFTIRDGSKTRIYRVCHDFRVQMSSNWGKSWHTYPYDKTSIDEALKDILSRATLDSQFACSHALNDQAWSEAINKHFTITLKEAK